MKITTRHKKEYDEKGFIVIRGLFEKVQIDQTLELLKKYVEKKTTNKKKENLNFLNSKQLNSIHSIDNFSEIDTMLIIFNF